jgi:hypothetical protein
MRDPAEPAAVFARVFRLLEEMEEAQKRKVIDLARRLKPGLTAEDIRNPHDFPDLDDPDWHFEDGQLTGIQSVRFAMTGLARELGAQHGEAVEDEGNGQEGAPG